jgi:serine protease DegS
MNLFILRLRFLVMPSLIGLVLGLAYLVINTGALSQQGTQSYANGVTEAAPSIVNIYTTKSAPRNANRLMRDPFFKRFYTPESRRRPVEQSSLGSGVIMNKEGYILTNNHVIQGASEIKIALNDGRETLATIVGTDPDADLAVLKISLNELPTISVAKNELNVGDVVLAIGNPFGVGQTVTLGIVGATGRHRLGLATYENFIQTDAAINPGNSGGALVNAKGELVGINTAIYSRTGGSQGIGFAIPIAEAQKILIDIAKHGRAIRGWLGLEAKHISPQLMQGLNLPAELSGLIVSGIYPDSPAQKSGIQRGDIITAVNGVKAIDGQLVMSIIAKLMPGDQIEISLIRDGAYMSTVATAGTRLPAEAIR